MKRKQSTLDKFLSLKPLEILKSPPRKVVKHATSQSLGEARLVDLSQYSSPHSSIVMEDISAPDMSSLEEENSEFQPDIMTKLCVLHGLQNLTLDNENEFWNWNTWRNLSAFTRTSKTLSGKKWYIQVLRRQFSIF